MPAMHLAKGSVTPSAGRLEWRCADLCVVYAYSGLEIVGSRRMPTVDSQHCILQRLYPVNHCVVGISFHFRFLHSLPFLELSVQHYVENETMEAIFFYSPWRAGRGGAAVVHVFSSLPQSTDLLVLKFCSVMSAVFLFKLRGIV